MATVLDARSSFFARYSWVGMTLTAALLATSALLFASAVGFVYNAAGYAESSTIFGADDFLSMLKYYAAAALGLGTLVALAATAVVGWLTFRSPLNR